MPSPKLFAEILSTTTKRTVHIFAAIHRVNTLALMHSNFNQTNQMPSSMNQKLETGVYYSSCHHNHWRLITSFFVYF